MLLSFCVVALFAVICPSAKATYIATLNEVGTDVVGIGSGSIDLTELTFGANGGPGSALINPIIAMLFLGSGDLAIYSGLSGPTNFGSGGFILANSQTGNIVGVFGGAVSLLICR